VHYQEEAPLMLQSNRNTTHPKRYSRKKQAFSAAFVNKVISRWRTFRRVSQGSEKSFIPQYLVYIVRKSSRMLGIKLVYFKFVVNKMFEILNSG
jgi:hypothetical protein